MAIIATLLGGIIGLVSFAIAMLAFDASFLSACAIYMISGFATTAFTIAIAMIPTNNSESETQNTVSA